LTNDPGCIEATLPTPAGPITFNFNSHHDRDYIASLIRANGLIDYEAPTPAVFAALVQDSPGLVLDIGANSGLFSLLAAAANVRVRVHAFEPLDDARDALCANIADNPNLQSRIVVEPFGLSCADGELGFYETINDQGLLSTSSSLELAHAQRIGAYCERRIRVMKLDTWATTHDREEIQLMKMDVEGHEYAALEGGRQTIARHRPFIIVEMLGHADFEGVNKILRDENYLDFALAREALRNCVDVRFHEDAWNHLLCPVEKAHRILMLCRQLNVHMRFS
jgi:FkbM family methyltransferase